MSLSARYVTQSHIYDCPKLGPLTNRRIAQYQKAGYYSGIKVEERKTARKKRAKSVAITRAKAFDIFNL